MAIQVYDEAARGRLARAARRDMLLDAAPELVSGILAAAFLLLALLPWVISHLVGR